MNQLCGERVEALRTESGHVVVDAGKCVLFNLMGVDVPCSLGKSAPGSLSQSCAYDDSVTLPLSGSARMPAARSSRPDRATVWRRSRWRMSRVTSVGDRSRADNAPANGPTETSCRTELTPLHRWRLRSKPGAGPRMPLRKRRHLNVGFVTAGPTNSLAPAVTNWWGCPSSSAANSLAAAG
jgi:hypothetical protein